MLPACFRIGDTLFPAVRREAARRLIESGQTQTEVAQTLGLSQGMVSKYLRAEPSTVPDDMAWLVEAMAASVVTGALDPSRAAHDAMVAGSDAGGNPWCRAMNLWQDDGDDVRRDAAARQLFQAVSDILHRIERSVPEALVPAVNINVAGALPEPTSRNDVVAFPGRLALVGGALRGHGPPAFGASSHLAALLVRTARAGSAARFVVNVRHDDAVRTAVEGLGVPVVMMDPMVRDEAGVADFDTNQVHRVAAFVALDPGSHGIEPGAYLAAADPEVLIGFMRVLAAAVVSA